MGKDSTIRYILLAHLMYQLLARRITLPRPAVLLYINISVRVSCHREDVHFLCRVHNA